MLQDWELNVATKNKKKQKNNNKKLQFQILLFILL